MTRLSPRQVEFLAMTAMGMKKAEIALKSGKSVWTVKAYLDSARFILGARTLPQAIAIAIAFEILGLDHEGNIHIPALEEYLVPEVALVA